MTETINRLNLWERNIKPRWRNTDYPQFFLVLCRRGQPIVSLSVHAWHLCTLFFISFSLQVLSCCLIVSPHITHTTSTFPRSPLGDLSVYRSLSHTLSPSTSLFTLALPEEQVRTDLISDWLIELLRLSLLTHTQTHRYTVDGFAGDRDRIRMKPRQAANK